MISGALSVSLFLLGTLGSLWSTVGTLHRPSATASGGRLAPFDYCFERMDQLDSKTVDILFNGILPLYVKPIVHENLRHWEGPDRFASPGSAYASLCECFIISADEMNTLVDRCMESAECEIPWWLPRHHFQSTVQETASRPGPLPVHMAGARCQYIWFVSKGQMSDIFSPV